MIDQQNTASVSTESTVKRHTIQVEYDYPDNTAGYVDYPDEDFKSGLISDHRFLRRLGHVERKIGGNSFSQRQHPYGK